MKVAILSPRAEAPGEETALSLHAGLWFLSGAECGRKMKGESIAAFHKAALEGRRRTQSRYGRARGK